MLTRPLDTPVTQLRKITQGTLNPLISSTQINFAYSLEHASALGLLDQALTSEVERQLEFLLEADDGMYKISILKHEPKDFSYGELRQEVEHGKFFQPLFAFGQPFLTSAGLSNESVNYYASLVQFYTVYKRQRIAVPTVRLYLSCFASHRYRQINDNLIEAFNHLVDDHEQQAKIAAQIAAAEAMAEATGNLQTAGQVLNLFLDPAIADSTPFSKVRQQAFALLDAERFVQVSGYMRKIEFDKTFVRMVVLWHAARQVQAQPMPSVLEPGLRRLGRGCAAARSGGLSAGDLAPRQIASPDEPRRFPDRHHREERSALHVHRGRQAQGPATPYRPLRVSGISLVEERPRSQHICVCDSNEFRGFGDDLIPPERCKDKDAVLREIGAPVLLAPFEQTLASFHAELEEKLRRVNRRIETGDNKQIQIAGVQSVYTACGVIVESSATDGFEMEGSETFYLQNHARGERCRRGSVQRTDLSPRHHAQSTSPVAWRNIHLIGNFDFTAGSSEVNIEALAKRYQNQDFWRRSMSDAEDEFPSA